MPIRMTGLNSGLDTEALVSELVSAYRKKGDKYTKAQTKISWKQEAWKSLSAQTSTFRKSLDSMRFSSGYNLKTTSVSNSAKVSVTAGNNAVNGSQTLEIKALAKSGYLTGGKVKSADGAKVEASTTMSDLGISDSGDISINGKRITIDGEMKVSDVIQKLKDAGVSANFDAENQRIFISASESGKDADFSLCALNENGGKALSALGLNVKPGEKDTTYSQYADKYGAMTEDDLAEVLATYDTDAENADRLISSFVKEYKAASDDETKSAVLQEFKDFIDYAKSANGKTDAQMGYNTDAARIYGQDAAITLNGADFTSSSNSFSINGLTINAMAVTDENEVLTITTSTDHQGIYDKIKDFLSEYNNLINAMTSAYNADKSTKEYEPLTDEEKEAMSEKEIEKWEDKGKSGILRRDSTLSTLMSVMTNVMSKSYEIDGKNYALSSFGIKTLGIMNAEKYEQNAYHIDGDADDESTSAKADKLMEAIIADPDGVTKFFQKLSTDLYDKLGEQMTSTGLRSYGSFYNDKEMDKQYRNYTKTISDWEDKIADIEDSYYKKFAAMESALAKLQSQSSQLSGLLGS